MSTIYKIDFDFKSQKQDAILKDLQAGNYKLFGFKGATGPNQITAGLPTWFAKSYMEMFGEVEIDYEPLYKVYVFNQATIGLNMTIHMEALSAEVPLGTALTYNNDGSFSISSNARPGTISLSNARSAGTSNITVGLAAKVNGQYAPFCAFTSTPQGVVVMEPNDKIALFASQYNLVSGSVIGNTLNSGCTFEFNHSSIKYDLEMMPVHYGITNTPEGLFVTEISTGTSLIHILNTLG